MQVRQTTSIEVQSELLDAIRSFPVHRHVEHCGAQVEVSPFEYYAECPVCGSRFKLRAFSAGSEIEDVFDAVFEWLSQPGAEEVANRRRQAIADDAEE